MRTALTQKCNLSTEQLAALDVRLQLSIELEGECGPIRAWKAYPNFLYALVLVQANTVIGLVEASGRPRSGPGWWIDPRFRGKCFGNELIDLLAIRLKQDGVTGLLPMPIQTPGSKYDSQSSKLVARLRAHFVE